MRNVLRALCALLAIVGFALAITNSDNWGRFEAGMTLGIVFTFFFALLFVKRAI